MATVKNCELCEKEFSKPSKKAYWQWEQQRFCSKSCKGKVQGFKKVAQPSKNCEVCNTIYTKPSNQPKEWWSKSRYCSPACFHSVPRPRLKQAKIKFVPRTRKGRKFPNETGPNNWRWISDRTLLKDDYKDRGGQLHREWSRCVKNRDGWKCKISNDSCSGRMEAHHILGWKSNPELRYEINNGITLCHYHHPRKREDEIKLSPYFQRLVEEAN